MTSFRFEDPWFLMLFFLLPFILLRARNLREAVIPYSSLVRLKASRAGRMNALYALPKILRALAFIFLILALAQPQERQKRAEILSAGVDIVLAIDTSGSMQAMDFMKASTPINRLEVVKGVVSGFIKNRQNDRMGMVVFGGEAFTQCPLTLDHDILIAFLEKLEIGVAGDSTAIGSALAIAVKRLKDLESKSKVIILLTDGRNNAGNLSPLQAAEISKTYGIKIYTIGVGTQGKAPFVVDSIFGKQYIYQNVEMDENTLKEIAQKTGAQYFRATDTETLENIYQQIDNLEKSQVKILDRSETRELFHYFLIPGLILILLEMILNHTRLRRIP